LSDPSAGRFGSVCRAPSRATAITSPIRIPPAAAAAQTPQPELHILADGKTPYERVAQVMSQAAKAGLSKIAFVTDPS